MENNWLSKTIENLEKNNWGKIPKDESYLVTTVNKLRKKQLKDFDIEDLRIMIGQNIGLKYLIPLAIVELEQNILAEGDFYEGDLLNSILNSDKVFWKDNKDDWQKIITLFNKNIKTIEEEAEQFDTGKKILKSFKHFNTLN